jgi:hypothetical protein
MNEGQRMSLNPLRERCVKYQADGVPAREVLEDLMVRTGTEESYSLRCEPLAKRDKHFCFINVHRSLNRLHAPIYRSHGSLVKQHISGLIKMILPAPQMLSPSGEERSHPTVSSRLVGSNTVRRIDEV